jgi:Fe-Mn family superoxide dismutase
MKFMQPRLPYAPDALSPVISQATVEYHYGKHEKAYLENLNRLVEGTSFADRGLEEIILTSEGAIYNNAAQAWNHIFYFFQFSPDGKHEPEGNLRRAIDEAFGSFERFKSDFERAGMEIFGSGWVWLASDDVGKLLITQGINASNPLSDGLRPIFTIDVWEHAYYLDYENSRAGYLRAVWDVVDWKIIEDRY